MNRIVKIGILAVFAVMLLLPLNGAEPATMNPSSFADDTSDDLTMKNGDVELAANEQDLAKWWNSSYIYRRYYNFTEPGVSDRINTPVHLFLEFEAGHCYDGSIRVLYYDDPDWTPQPFQIWNTTYDATGTYILSTRVTFLVNVSQSQREPNYYIYYAKEDVGSVSYPDFYPFIYKSYTFSLLSLISYYDNNQYNIEKYDTNNQVWDDPRNLDDRWAGTSGSVYTTNVPNGTLSAYEQARYEPEPYSYSLFQGYYAVYSNYPMAVHVGQGDEGSNSAINDWFPGVSELGSGTATEWVLGGVEGFDSRNEGKYWIQAHEDDTEVYVWTSSMEADTGWKYINNSAASFPAVLDAGEYIYKGDYIYTSITYVNATKAVSTRMGDQDCSHARDIWAFYPAINGDLAGEEFYTIDMGHSSDYTRVTNLNDTTVEVDWYRNSGSGFVFGGTLTIAANSSQLIARGTASDTNTEDILHIVAEENYMIMVEGLYNPTSATDAGDWVPTITGDRYGSNYKLWGTRSYKFMIVALENAEVDIEGYNGQTLEIPKGGMTYFMPWSTSMTLYHITSNATVGVVDVGKFSTTSPYYPTSDTGFGWMVPAYSPENDQNGFSIDLGEEVNLFELDVTVVDLDGVPVEGATVTLYNTTGDVWEDDNGRTRTGTTDANGLIIFEGLSNITYDIRTNITATWLSSSQVWESTDSTNQAITGSVTPVTITLDLASIEIHFDDLMSDSMNDNPDETTTVRLSPDGNTANFTDYDVVNSTGWAYFYRVPVGDYDVFVRYDGPVDSYTYDDMTNFGAWTISQTEFIGGSFSHPDWVLPLVTMNIYVNSWDDQPVEGATIKINNTLNENAYSITATSDENGYFEFYRIVNGTWQMDVWKDDDYPLTQTARNNTADIIQTNVQGEITFTVNLAITRLNIEVRQEGTEAVVQNAQVNVTLVGVGLIAQGNTNSSGQVTFFYIHGNMSSPYSLSYTVDVISGDQSESSVIVKCDFDWTYENVIYIIAPTYNEQYTELNSTAYFLNVRWGRNATAIVGYYDRDGDNDTSQISSYVTTWVNFSIFFESTFIGSGTWNNSGYFYVTNDGTINFTIIIDTDYWLMNASETPYTIRVSAHTDTYDDPAPITLYVTVQNALTDDGSETTSIVDYYGSHNDYQFWLEDTTNNVNVTDLDIYTYTIKRGSTTIASGDLNPSGDVFILPQSVLNQLNVDFYTLIISLEKQNYISQSITGDITVEEIPMQVIITPVSGYDWNVGTTQDITFTYIFDPDNTTNPGLSSVTVVLRWYTDAGVSYLNATKTLSASGGTFTYTFSSDLLPVGDWNLTITCSKANYAQATKALASLLTVSPAPITMGVTGSSDITVDWLGTANFLIFYERTAGSVPLSGASYTHNWTDSINVAYMGDGEYSISLGTNLESGSYVLDITFSKDNHDNAAFQLTVNIRVPLLIETEFGSSENPLEVYWTESFVLEVFLWDQSRTTTPVDSATISYDWYLESIVDLEGGLDGQGSGFYNISLNAFDAVPQSELYEIIITATDAGATTDVTTIFVRILAVPNEIILEQQYFEQYYADIFEIRFFWNNTLTGDGIETYDSSITQIVNPAVEIMGLFNHENGTYSLLIDTRTLGMTAAVSASFYIIQIDIFLEGFQTHDIPETVFVLMRETDTSLLIDVVEDVYWSDNIFITATLYDALHGGMIWESASITVYYGPYSENMINYQNGTFRVNFTSSLWFAARDEGYVLTLNYTLPNYVDSFNTTSVIVNPIEGVIIPDELTMPSDDSITVKWSNTFEVRVGVNDIYRGNVPIEFADVFYLWSGYITLHPLTFYDDNDDYFVVINAGEVPAGVYELYIRVINENYTIPDYVLDITIETVDTELSADATSYTVYTDATGLDILLTFSISDTAVSLSGNLVGATITMTYAGTDYTATYQAGTGQYQLNFDPSDIDLSYIPGVLELNITATLVNYTTITIHPSLTIYARTSLTGPSVVAEEGSTLWIVFQYFDLANQVPIGTNNVIDVSVTTPIATYTLSAGQITYNGSHYLISLVTEQIGELRAEPYSVYLSATAPMYENKTDVAIQVTISEQTLDILSPIGLSGFLVVPVSLLMTILYMTVLFGAVAGAAVGYRRWKIPVVIKQINKAVSAIEDQKTAKVENIKSMGQVISELLAAGLAELDISAPAIDVGPGYEYDVLAEETDDLLGELDALDEIGADEAPEEDISEDYESELEAELDSIVEERPVDEASDVDESEVSQDVEETEAEEVVEDDESEGAELEEAEEAEEAEQIDETDDASIETDDSETEDIEDTSSADAEVSEKPEETSSEAEGPEVEEADMGETDEEVDIDDESTSSDDDTLPEYEEIEEESESDLEEVEDESEETSESEEEKEAVSEAEEEPEEE